MLVQRRNSDTDPFTGCALVPRERNDGLLKTGGGGISANAASHKALWVMEYVRPAHQSFRNQSLTNPVSLISSGHLRSRYRWAPTMHFTTAATEAEISTLTSQGYSTLTSQHAKARARCSHIEVPAGWRRSLCDHHVTPV